MRAKGWISAVAVACALAPVLAHRPARIVPLGIRQAHPYRVRGAVHVHTRASRDGFGDLDDVARAARAAGLSFVVVTDHNVDLNKSAHGQRQGVLLINGLEKSTDGGHALVLGVESLPFRLDGDPATVVRDATELGGFVVAAHPTSSAAESRWTSDMRGVAGLEFLNLAEPRAWPDRGPALLWPLVRYAADPQGALLRSFGHSREALELWDRSLAERPLAGVLGSDAHGGFVAGPLRIPVPSHLQVFRFASQHLLLASPLTADVERNAELVLEALRSGRGYGAVDALADASGFILEARCGEARALMGEALRLEGQAEIHAAADAPAHTTLVLFKDGREVARGPRIGHPTREAGVYRVEAYLDPKLTAGAPAIPWIVSNPVYLFGADELARREREAERLPLEDSTPIADVEALDDFQGPALAAEWQVDRSADAEGRASLEAGALRFDYALGPAMKTHASICDWRPRDLTPFAGLVFRVRADRELRFDVQVRVADETASDRVRIWRRSVRAGLAWRRAAVPFDHLRTYDHWGGRPDVARARGIYFHLDEAHLPPGSRGVLWIDDLGLANARSDHTDPAAPRRQELMETAGRKPEPHLP